MINEPRRSTLGPDSEALRLEGIQAYYGDSHVLHDVTMSLREGKVLALLGRNGAGKTTSMNVVVGFLPAREGEVTVHGQRITRLSPEAISRAGVGLVPQGRRVFPNLTVRENLIVAEQPSRFGLANPWSLDRVYELFSRLKERHHQTAGSLSGGEQQMLAIGRALMTNPRILLLDEPSEGLAPLIVAEVGRTIAKLKAEGLSIVLVEQNMKLALSLADDVVVLNTGSVAYSGSAQAVLEDDSLITPYLGVFHEGGHA
jgi:branched-chain amino acid transport system ATP-binding protein